MATLTRMLPPTMRYYGKKWFRALRKSTALKHSYVHTYAPRSLGEIDTYHQTNDNRQIAVYRNYRYSIKKGWTYFNGLYLLHLLNLENLATDEDREILNTTIGHRTLTQSIDEVQAYIQTIIPRIEPHIIPESTHNQTPILKPTDSQIAKTTNTFLQSHRNLFLDLEHQGIFSAQPNQRVLEIGFDTGGYSLFALEQLGFQVSGIDNQYGGLVEAGALPEYIKKNLHSQVSFHHGDITQTTHFDDETFDVIYSASVLEHITDIPNALTEMFRLLKPNGVLIHKYHPFYCPSGGHTLGIPDTPWGHCQLTHTDYVNYIEDQRPFEADYTKPWLSKALTRDYPISRMQHALAQANFKITYWQETPTTEQNLADLTPQIQWTCFQTNPQIGLSDLITESIMFVAQKPNK
ncbi:MAG: class I SAM-dependent methyltransferase [Candidatus Latescibacteria bacterium]|nr:class I SAM-dependent methyltransferase [Candidatus Latescibacterota bacterium]MBT4138248.1 class I SAM-dependent methyltransferase [Candidatus Latescibacterota bacterium]